MKNQWKRVEGAIALAAMAIMAGGCSKGEPGAGGAAASVVPYPLEVCSVSGEKLGSMGKPYVITYEGREIKFCCGGCEEDFREDAATFLAKIDAGAAESPAP